MSLETMRARTESDFEVAWALAFPSVPVWYNNARFTQPQGKPWVAFYNQHVVAKRAAIGTLKRFTRDTGFVCVEIYVPEHSGTVLLNQMGETAANVFEDKEFILSDQEHVTFYSAQKKSGVRVNGFVSLTVMIPFRRDASKLPVS